VLLSVGSAGVTSPLAEAIPYVIPASLACTPPVLDGFRSNIRRSRLSAPAVGISYTRMFKISNGYRKIEKFFIDPRNP
jgi:hypothetical protein